jgi:hypothetical protein
MLAPVRVASAILGQYTWIDGKRGKTPGAPPDIRLAGHGSGRVAVAAE